MNKKVIVSIVIVLVSIAIFFAYRYLGGFTEFTFSLKDSGPYHIIGKPFEGRYNNPLLEAHFFEIKSLIDKKAYDGPLVVVNYELVPEKAEKGFVKQFIGVLVTEKPALDLEGKLAYLYLPKAKAAETRIVSHNLVMPKADAIHQRAEQFLSEKELRIGKVSLEEYRSDEELIVTLRAEQ